MALYDRLNDLGCVFFSVFDGGAVDLMGNLADGTEVGVTYQNDSPFTDVTQSAYFDGGSRIVFPRAAIIDNLRGLVIPSTEFVTWGAWIKVKNDNGTWDETGSTTGVIMSKHDTANTDNGWYFGIEEAGSGWLAGEWVPKILAWGPSTNNWTYNSAGQYVEPTVDDNEWHFITFCERLNNSTEQEGVTVNGDWGNANTISSITGGNPTTDAGADLWIGDADGVTVANFEGNIGAAFIVPGRVSNDHMCALAQIIEANVNKYDADYHEDVAVDMTGHVMGHWFHPKNVTDTHADWLKITNWAPKSGIEVQNTNYRINTNPLELTGVGDDVSESLTTPADDVGWSGVPFAINFAGVGLNDDKNNLSTQGGGYLWGGSYLNSGTVELVFKVDTAASGTIQIIYVNGRHYGTNLHEYSVEITATGKLFFRLSRASTDDLEIETTAALSDNTWYHAIIRAKGDGSDYDIMLNGADAGVTVVSAVATSTNNPRTAGYGGVFGNGWTHTSGNADRYPFNGDIAMYCGYTSWLTDGNRTTLWNAVQNGGIQVPEPVSISQHVLALGNVY